MYQTNKKKLVKLIFNSYNLADQVWLFFFSKMDIN